MSILTEMETWGQVVAVHQLGELAIAEYHPWLAGHGRRPDLATTQYHGYYAGRDTARVYSTLARAIVGTLAYHYDGPNSQAGIYFARMVGLPEQEAETAAVAPFEIDTQYFRWGHFVQTHALRDIRIVEFHPWTEKGWGKESDPAVTLYHAWFGDAVEARWQDTGFTSYSLDMALVTALARKHDHIDHPQFKAIAAVYFALMVQMPGAAEQEYTG